MDLVRQLLDIVLHLSEHLGDWTAQMGNGIYVLLFAIIFAETGLVVTPFLPGDSLLFAVGAVAAQTENATLSIYAVIPLLIVAAVIGDAVNYAIGARIGPKVFDREDSRLLNKKHLIRTHQFYEKHGGKTIILARFMPIIRTFAPFVAGVGKMGYQRFFIFNVVGGTAWVVAFASGGYAFGGLESVKKNFHLVIIAIVIISVLPAVIEYFRNKK